MIYGYLLAAALIQFVCSVVITLKTMAQSIDVPFSGTVGGSCTLGLVTPGVLTLSGELLAPSAFKTLDLGEVYANCNQPASLIVSQPIQTVGLAFTPVKSWAGVYSSALNTTTNSDLGSSPLALPSDGTNTLLMVDMYVDKGSPLEEGTYGYKVSITIIP
ncbi:hypothetical protein H6G06_08205 [Anabaena sphaerica FACHB-251]|uniref:Spore coat protein U domain-containing protein n=1 Tax=Anabaena sphaerica FACHB-251 TaxID=2692883 RepID=A0A926WG36_9NOST|nr:hypothetical protein [Anabaena sphaerica]MBD2293470.1 hypothetical protein [Anabaena sphaerica FACHB-251]